MTYRLYVIISLILFSCEDDKKEPFRLQNSQLSQNINNLLDEAESFDPNKIDQS